MTLEDLLIETVSKMGFPIRLQGSLAPNEVYPDHFFTFWNNTSDGASFYNNDENTIVWEYSLNFYSIDPIKTNTVLLDVKKLLKKVGFIVTGAGYSLASDKPTHTGRGITVYYRQKI